MASFRASELVGVVTLRPTLAVIGFVVFLQAHTTMSRAAGLADPGHGFDPGFARALKKQAQRRREQGGKGRPWFLKAWLGERRERKAAALLAIARTMGITALSASDREWLKRRRG